MSIKKTKILDFAKFLLLNWRLQIMFFLLQFASLRAYYKRLPSELALLVPVFIVLLYFLSALILYKLKKRYFFNRLLNKPTFFVVLLLVVFFLNCMIYPVADNLKLIGRGSDQDDGLILSGRRMVCGLNPFSAKTYLNCPISPGPGWVILALPFTLSGGYFLFVPVGLLLLALLILREYRSLFYTNLTCLFCLTSFGFWETMFMGSDMFVLGVFFVVCLYLIYKSTDRGGISAYAGMALLAFLSTSRVVFLYLIAIVAFFLYRKDRFKYFRHICFSLTLALILHGYFFLPDPAAYSPLHIITKGDQLLTNPFRIFCIIAFLTAIYLTFKKLKNNLRSWIFYFWLATAIPLFFISLSDLSLQKFNFSRWEGANYLMIVIPAYLFYFVMCLAEENKEGF